MQRLEVSCAVRRLYESLGVKGLKYPSLQGTLQHHCRARIYYDYEWKA